MPQTITPSDATTERRRLFFNLIFGDAQGYIGFSEKSPSIGWRQTFFEYPTQTDDMLQWIDYHVESRDLYFCTQLLAEPVDRKAHNVKACTVMYADLDTVDPNTLDLKPTVTVRSSDGHWHAYWRLNTPADKFTFEDANQRLTYAIGADKSGWDLSQVLRVPVSYNMKFDPPTIVDIDAWNPKLIYEIETFLALPEVAGAVRTHDIDFPTELFEHVDPNELVDRYRLRLPGIVQDLYNNDQPSSAEGRSGDLWRLEKTLLEHDVPKEEVLVIAWNSAANKYKLNGRQPNEMWAEICKAEAQMHQVVAPKDEPGVSVPDLMTAGEREGLPDTFVDRYTAWGRSRTDASWQYHQISAMVILSACLADGVHLPVEYGHIVPNIWAMILGDTTLTRKTTAMDMAMELIQTVYEEAYLASDASIEGLLSAVATRPNRTSMFVRDEFAGMLEGVKHREYQAGMLEALTKLYDGKYQKRQLRKETIEVRDPVFIMYCGGIRSRILELLSSSDISSGFIPRFLFVSAEPDMDAFRPLGPPTGDIVRINSEFVEYLMHLRSVYDVTTSIMVGTQQVTNKQRVDAHMTTEAWERSAELERVLVTAGRLSERPDDYTPTFDRMAKSTLKCAVLLAASRQDPEDNRITVELEDILQAIKYIDHWKQYTIDVIENAGLAVSERTLGRIISLIRKGKNTRASIMTAMHLNSRETDQFLETLEQRGMLVRKTSGKSQSLRLT